jgi:hypothetical protein
VSLDKGGAENYWNYLFGIFFSISTSFAILMFTVRGKKKVAYFFLAVEVFINTIHYKLWEMDTSNPAFWSTMFMCLIIPVNIAMYSEESTSEPKKAAPADPIPTPVPRPAPGPDPVPAPAPAPEPMPDRQAILSQINKDVGFNVSDVMDFSGNLEPYKKQKVKDIWSRMGESDPIGAQREINKLLNGSGNLLFD